MNYAVNTYYEEIGSTQSKRLLDLWVSVWKSHGWSTSVLGRSDAEKHPKFNQLEKHVSQLPTVNGTNFEMACYRRWCAYALVGGVTMDYDVFPRIPFPPRGFVGFYSGDICGGPGFISGKPSDFERILDLILDYKVQPDDITFNKPHVSDMIILRRHREIYDQIENLTPTYNTENWDTAPLVHFANAYMKHKGTMDRADEIRSVLKI